MQFFVALGVGTPEQISAGGETLVWFVHQILLCLNCYCAKLKPLCFSICTVFILQGLLAHSRGLLLSALFLSTEMKSEQLISHKAF